MGRAVLPSLRQRGKDKADRLSGGGGGGQQPLSLLNLKEFLGTQHGLQRHLRNSAFEFY